MTGGNVAARDAARFAGLAIGLSWVIGVPAILGDRGDWLPKPLVGFGLVGYAVGPAAAALTLIVRSDGRAGVRRLLDRFRDRRFPAGWWLAVPAAAAGAALTASGPLRHAGLPGPGLTDLPAALAAAPVVLIAAAFEEVGWRGYLLPRLQTRVTPLAASVLIGIPWGLWHLPLLLQPTGPNTQVPVWAYPAGALAGSFVYTALFNATRGSLLIVIAVHAMRNVVSGVFLNRHGHPAVNPTLAYGADLALMLSAAVILSIATRRREPVRPDTAGQQQASHRHAT